MTVKATLQSEPRTAPIAISRPGRDQIVAVVRLAGPRWIDLLVKRAKLGNRHVLDHASAQRADGLSLTLKVESGAANCPA
jgi:hypothetical protein